MANETNNSEKSVFEFPQIERLEFGVDDGEATRIYQRISKWFPNNNVIVFNGNLFELDGMGTVFIFLNDFKQYANMLLWKQELGEKMKIISSEESIIGVFENGEVFGYNAMFLKKEARELGLKIKVSNICFVEMTDKSSCRRLEQMEIIHLFLKSVFWPNEPNLRIDIIELADFISEKCTFWEVKCNTKANDFKKLYNMICGE